MKNTLAVLLLSASLLGSLPAHAATMNIVAGDSGSFIENNVTQVENDGWVQYQPYVTGTLSANTSVTFTFSVTDGSALASCNEFTLHADSSYSNYTDKAADGSYNYNFGTSATLSATGSEASTTGSTWGGYNMGNEESTYVSYTPLTALIVSYDKTEGTITITNLSDFAVWFKVALDTEIQNLTGDILITYETSPVPLPAALPLFGAGLLGLGLFGKKWLLGV